MPMRRRTSIGSTPARVDVLAVVGDLALDPGARIRSFIRLRQRSTVDLPQPDGPISAVISFWPKPGSTSRTARKSP